MDERVSIPLPADLAAWLKREAERQERPVAFVARKAIEAARRRQNEQVAA
jgi:predicted transcriptional regulator